MAPPKPKPKREKKRHDEVRYTDIQIGEKIGEVWFVCFFLLCYSFWFQGSFGTVFKGSLWGQDIALKKLRIKTADVALKSFKAEVKIMRFVLQQDQNFNDVCYLGQFVTRTSLR